MTTEEKRKIHFQKISNALKGKKLSEKQKLAWCSGRPHSEETRLKISKALSGKKRKPLSEEHKHLLSKLARIASIRHIEKFRGSLRCNIGKNEKPLLDRQEKIDNCKIRRQFQIKELGYIVDGYCPETNTVYEVYEPFHERQIQKDIRRQSEIQEYLRCNFKVLCTQN